MPLLRTVLVIAVTLTMLYLLGFLIKLVGSPIRQFTDVLDLMRSIAMTSWIMWAIFFAADKIIKKVRRQRLTEFAAEIGIDEIGARRDRRNGFSAAH